MVIGGMADDVMLSMDFPCTFAKRIDQTVGDYIEDRSQQFFQEKMRELVVQVQFHTAAVVVQGIECPLTIKPAKRTANELHPDG